MPPHVIMGYSLTEWLALFSLFSIFIGVLTWFVNITIIKPLRYDIKDLSSEFKSFKEETKSDNHTLSEMVTDHEKRLIRVEDKVGR
ncbi:MULTISPECIES: hypothetical protein [Companilactobacillus]|uniref:Uncharacterized protein n=2 Tax=Companilactobacillus bobalius TaxID=2801451 RepID=A0A202FEM8_9LACO|nr:MULTISPECIES: hypothetical protein [Companilactobacillus]KAE9560634.1 hypothetical protein ATN92_10890 [Companilactobacillus bobalius]KAE9564421.1 hypothetical protein ATN92_00540 [Companilactobacillus bobalius]OVE98892.1 hypothetical protein LKACC16343_00004 [Companilactobacillus bobalius]GEO59666.1 hypothetical protein LBO01_27950 [Companilactobacillus paralimentarius]